MRQIKIITAAAAALLLIACGVKAPIYDTDHPEQARITVATDWSGLGEGVAKPAEYVVAYGNEKWTATADTYAVPHLFDAGSHTLYFYNAADHITVTGTVATIAPATRAASIAPLPGWLCTARLEVAVEKDTEPAFAVKMVQQVGQLTLVIEPTGSTADKIETITATLSGVAAGYDLATGTHTAPSEIQLTFAKDTDGKWKATVRLLGVAGAQQKLSGTIAFTDGIPGDMPLESDLTAQLADFNHNKNIPLMLDGGLLELSPNEAEFTATIDDWTVVDNGQIEIH